MLTDNKNIKYQIARNVKTAYDLILVLLFIC